MFTSDTDKLNLLFSELRKEFSKETVDTVRTTIKLDPVNAQGCAITKDRYAFVWKELGVMDAIIRISEEYGIRWMQTPFKD